MDTHCCTYVPLKTTGYFSNLVTDYMEDEKVLQPFYRYIPDDKGLSQAISDRPDFSIDRSLLVSTLLQQYRHYEVSDAVRSNIESLQQENTFTVCTAHQPNLMGGYLYFIYKIIHTVKLSKHLKTLHPDKNFVPVYYIGSEDNDFEELSVFGYEGDKYQWQTDQTGAVGRMKTNSLNHLLDALFKKLGPPGEAEKRIKNIITKAYREQPTIAAATRTLVNELMGTYGVVAIDPDDKALKSSFIPVIKEELFRPAAHNLVTAASQELEHHYKAQAYVRPINLFYLKDNIRERIERTGMHWKVLNTDIEFNETELLAEIEQYPERFSPNVILRGLYQETILPNVAFIGGGSEIAYWMQLKSVFDHYNVFYPALILRQSALWIDADARRRIDLLGLSREDIFRKKDSIKEQLARAAAGGKINLQPFQNQMQELLAALKIHALAVDETLAASADAALKKMKYQGDVLETKILRAVKRKEKVQMLRIDAMREKLFPNENLQERSDSFLHYYLLNGGDFFEKLLDGTLPYGNQFLLVCGE